MTAQLTNASDNFLEFFNLLKNKEFAVSYFGDFSMAIKNAVLADVRRKLDILENKIMLRKRIFAVADESFDNIINYARVTGQDSYQSLFSLFRESNEYVLTIGNQVEAKDLDSLRTKMEAIVNMRADDLNREYKQTLTNPLPVESQGAGLGIMVMAKRSGNKLDYFFEKLSSGNYFFILRIRIS
jgi:hypothetical protein